ncbi:MAG: PepSY domain-containing protein [Verrucomicrobia bacterium]|nr:PepSY domain-containing protein [Verrucomicrobiota bacterium]
MSAPSAPKPKNWLLVKSRQWHTWAGLIAGAFLLVVGATGIVLNYKKPIFQALGLEPQFETKSGKSMERPKVASGAAQQTPFSTSTGWSAAAISPEQILARARTELGDTPLERIELKSEHGELVWKVKAHSGQELIVQADTGVGYIRGAYEKTGKPGPDGIAQSSTDWGKIALDLHTGKIGGEVGKALMTGAAVVLLFLTWSGVYLWAKPVLIRRTNARARAAAAAAVVPTASPLPPSPALAPPSPVPNR